MTTQNWKLGIGISIGIGIIGISQKLIRMDHYEYSEILLPSLYSFIFCFFNWIAHGFLLQNIWYQRFIPNRITSGIIAILGVASTVMLCEAVLPDFNNALNQFQDLSADKKIAMLLFRGLLVSGLFYFIIYHLHILSEKQKNSIEIGHLKQAQLEASLSSLKEQLSPHFLFNTLNTLSSLTTERTVKNYVSELADVYRYLLHYKEMNTSTVEEELKFIESYFYIIKTRLEDAIEISIEVNKTLLQSKIPPLTFQLLIENAIKHNIASSSKKLKVYIYNQGNDYLVVQNNYQPKSSIQLSTGIGIANIIHRYHLLFKKEVFIERNEETFTVKLPIV